MTFAFDPIRATVSSDEPAAVDDSSGAPVMASLCRRTIFALTKKTAKAEQLLALAVERVTFLAAKGSND